MRFSPIIPAAAVLWTAPLFAQGPAQEHSACVPEVCVPQVGVPGTRVPEDDGRGTPYVVDKNDNICGIDEPRAITNPAKVDYQALLDVTPEVKEIKRKKIDPESAKGIDLMTKARRRVLAACETVRSSESHCSVWKKIKRRDKQALADVTDKVKAELKSSDEV